MDWKEILRVSVPTSVILFALWMASEYLAFSDHGYREALGMVLLSAPLASALLLSRKKKTNLEVLVGIVLSFLATLLLWVPLALFGF